jgi:cyclase
VKEGRVVKGIRFQQLKDAGDPVACAQAYDRAKADELVFLDITASWEKRKTMLAVVERVADRIFIPFTVGGGLRSLLDIRDLLKAGCDKVSLNTSAVENPRLVREASRRFGSQCVVVAIDAQRESKGRWRVYTRGGRIRTRFEAVAWAKKVMSLGAGEILLTSMDRDGTRQGYDVELTRRVSNEVSIPVIASGGAGSLKHLWQILSHGNADAALAASIFHYGEVTVMQAKQYLKRRGISVRT